VALTRINFQLLIYEMKILIVTTGYPRNDDDPSGIFIKRLAMAITKAGARVTILAPGDREAKPEETDGGIRIFRFIYAPRCLMRIGYGDGGILENLHRWPWLFIVLPFFLLSMIIHTILLAKHCDVIHANWLAAGFLSLPAKKIRKKALVVTLRGSDLRRGALKTLPFVVRKANAITTVNKKWAESLQEKSSCNVFYTPNGVEVSSDSIDPRLKFGIDASEIIALYIGALRQVKGADVLAEAAKIAMGQVCSVRFLVIGPGDPRRFGLDKLKNVIYAGTFSPGEALAVYSSCDIFILPSRFEGRPNSLLEAMAAGLPSVATRLPGVLEVLTDDCGILIDTEDPLALAEAICKLAKNPVMRKTMGEKAKTRIAELSLNWESSAKEYLRVFEEVRSCAA
jgi:glycosyltransferase involved in cell wall biosynthesis